MGSDGRGRWSFLRVAGRDVPALGLDPLRRPRCGEWLRSVAQDFEDTEGSSLDVEDPYGPYYCANRYCPVSRRTACNWRRFLVGALLKVRIGVGYRLAGRGVRPDRTFETIWPLVRAQLPEQVFQHAESNQNLPVQGFVQK